MNASPKISMDTIQRLANKNRTLLKESQIKLMGYDTIYAAGTSAAAFEKLSIGVSVMIATHTSNMGR